MTDHVVLADGLSFPEGPAFTADGALWGVELNGGALFRWADDRIDRLIVGGRPNGLAIRDGFLFFCDAGQDQIRRIDLGDGLAAVPTTVTQTQPDAHLTAPNDLAFSRKGTLVFTCPGDSRYEPTGTVWARRPSGALRRVASDLRFPNGLAFTRDGRELIVAETFQQRLWRGQWDEAGCAWIDAAPWIEIGGPIGPDGMAFGWDGLLYVAVYGQGVVVVVDDEGRVRQTIDVPGPRPTNLAFDPTAALGMIVTEAETGRLLSYPTVGA